VSAGEEETKAQEILIIRRPLGGEDAPHKGGVWKIAYADFMTAMMAFFLVMWLINASDKQTLTQVATYFNPLRLTDKVALSKGLHQADALTQSDPKPPGGATKDEHHSPAGEKAAGNEKNAASSKKQAGSGKGESKAEGSKPKYTEDVLFRDPYGVLSKLASQAAEEQSRPTQGGEAYRDPFDPVFRRESRGEKHQGGKPAGASESSAPAATPLPPAVDPRQSAAAQPQAPSTTPVVSEAQKPSTEQPAAEKPTTERTAEQPEKAAIEKAAAESGAAEKAAAKQPLESGAAEKAAAQKVKDERAAADTAAGDKAAAEKAAERAAAAKLETDIREVIARAIAGALPNITVTVTDEGILISLTDDQNFGMFAIASAEPRPAMVVLMDKLGKVIPTFPERLVVRGHTDGRPYKSGTYDNWRLSSQRAHMAYYMLVRSGIDEKRFERIEGHADRNLKVPDDPEAAQNRRIEILLRRARS
jgi:chemotaxis protein MotB